MDGASYDWMLGHTLCRVVPCCGTVPLHAIPGVLCHISLFRAVCTTGQFRPCSLQAVGVLLGGRILCIFCLRMAECSMAILILLDRRTMDSKQPWLLCALLCCYRNCRQNGPRGCNIGLLHTEAGRAVSSEQASFPGPIAGSVANSATDELQRCC